MDVLSPPVPGARNVPGDSGAKPALGHTKGCPPTPRGLLGTFPQGFRAMLTNILGLYSKIPNVHVFFSILPFLWGVSTD